MNTKYNTEEIMMLIPDYITGNISSSDKALVEKALSESAELTELYMDMKSSVGFIDSVKQAEPAPQYWNTLLPRIHERIEERQNKGFSWEKTFGCMESSGTGSSSYSYSNSVLYCKAFNYPVNRR